VGCGVPIVLEKSLTVDLFAALFFLPPLERTALHLDLDPQVNRSAGEGSYSPNGSTPYGVLSKKPVPLASRPFTELAGIQCPYRFDGDVKQHLGGLQ